MRPVRLSRRFFASVFARPLRADERVWVASALEPGELALWDAQPRYDRRHTFGVARRVGEALSARGTQPGDERWVAAALLHDVGKVEAGLGIVGRVVATLTMAAVGHARVRGWAGVRGWRGRLGRYADHGEIGARLIRAAGGREDAARWTAVHHRVKGRNPVLTVGLPDDVVTVLADADRD